VARRQDFEGGLASLAVSTIAEGDLDGRRASYRLRTAVFQDLLEAFLARGG
jgi:hypothetical protein